MMMNLKEKCDLLLEAMVSEDLVEKWWQSPNKHWDGRTPIEVFKTDEQSVFDYLLSYALR